jgi:peroxiredoxin Q/BCP
MPDTVISQGKPAPDFNLPASTGEQISLKNLRGKTVVLYFYPRADTPGCTVEACGFRDAIADYDKANVKVIGISPDPIEDVRKFSDKFHLNFPLVADADHSVAEAYGVWQKKQMAGKEYMGVVRTTFVIDKDGNIARVFEKVKPDGHEKEILQYLQSAAKPAV